jgi:hypothetical protein
VKTRLPCVKQMGEKVDDEPGPMDKEKKLEIDCFLNTRN